MPITVYNSLTRRKEPLEPVKPGRIGIYLCGPTVYKPSHIGHAVGPIIFDAIKRYLVHRGYDVTWVVNITDVDDKLIVEAGNQGVTTFELAERITKDYLDAMARLHVDTIDIMPKASEHIGDIVAVIQRLMEKDIAYQSNGDVYFDVTKDRDYGKLSNRRPEEQETGRRDLKSGQKRNPGDFALWKAARPEEPDEVKFDSPFGPGRPGWHIECSAMASRYLGETFDIHGGGLDLIFPHHENEIAQSECASGKPFARIWMHNGLTRVNTKKISKSDASPDMVAALTKMTLNNLLREVPGELLRFFVLSTHYRRPIEYSDEELDGKRKGLHSFYRLFDRVERITGRSPYEDLPASPLDKGGSQRGSASPLGKGGPRGVATESSGSGANLQSPALASAAAAAYDNFHRAMDDDFNTAAAIASMFDYATAINRFIEQEKLEAGAEKGGSQGQASPLSKGGPRGVADAFAATQHLVALGRLIGLFLEPPARKQPAHDDLTDKVMQILIQVRQHARKKKDFETADLIRDSLKAANVTLEDRPDGTIWRRE